MNSLKQSLELLKKMKAENPQLDFSEIEQSISSAIKEDAETFYKLTKEDLRVCFEEEIEGTLLEEIKNDLKNEFVEEIFTKIKDRFFIENWTDFLKGWIEEPIEREKGKYIIRDINPEWVGKWDKYNEIVDPDNRMRKGNLDNELLHSVSIFSEYGFSDELDTALEEIREYERYNVISKKQFDEIMDLWFS